MWSCMPTRPGSTVLPRMSRTVVPDDAATSAPAEIAAILPFSMVTLRSSTAGFPVPSTTRTCVGTMRFVANLTYGLTPSERSAEREPTHAVRATPRARTTGGCFIAPDSRATYTHDEREGPQGIRPRHG